MHRSPGTLTSFWICLGFKNYQPWKPEANREECWRPWLKNRSLPFLTTKLFVPHVPGTLVARRRLLDRLDAGLAGKLTLVSAPAGYGKSTLLAEWVRQAELPFAWLSLDAGDDDPTRFWSYFAAALQSIRPAGASRLGVSLSGSLEVAPLPEGEALLASLIAEIAALDERFVLILDDFHSVTDPDIHEALQYFIERLPSGPSGLHIILSSRSDPPWRLARIRAQGALSEIRARLLRFTQTEAVRFMNEAMSIALTSEDLAALDARTEGWIAGLQMAAISMRGREDKTGFIRAFTGSHRFVMDYLMEEVLERQSPEIQEFLLKTSVLERLNSALCAEVVEENPSAGLRAEARTQAILETLEQNNLFLVPLDDERCWYRYHHLFADLLQNRLRARSPESVRSLNRSACRWFLARGDIPDAIRHAFAAEDLDLAADIIEANVLTFMGNNALASVVHLLDRFPQDAIDQRPWLSLASAWAFTYLGDAGVAETHLAKVENRLSRTPQTLPERHIRGHVASIRCHLSFFDADFARSAAFGYTALQDLAESDYQTRMLTASIMAAALRWNGSLAEAHTLLLDAVGMAKKLGADYTHIRLQCGIALTEMNRAMFHQAVATLNQALALSRERSPSGDQDVSPFSGMIHIRLAEAYFHMNRLDLALQNVHRGIDLAETWGQATTLWDGYFILTDVLLHMGNQKAARDAHQQAGRYALRLSSRVTDEQTEILQAKWWLAEGNFESLGRWLEEKGVHTPCAEIPYSKSGPISVLVELLLARGQAHEALEVLAKTRKTFEAAGARSNLITDLVFTALAHHQLGQESRALEALSRALALAEGSGLLLVFAKHGGPLKALLRQLHARGVSQRMIDDVFAAITGGPDPAGSADAQPLIEPLSGRELDVLRMLNTRLSVPEIATELFLAPSTVRTHVQNIYQKLGVHGRLEALHRAKTIRLI